MSDLFQEFKGARVIISNLGGLRDMPLYQRVGSSEAYVLIGGYYCPLTANNGIVSKKTMRWTEFYGEKASLLEWKGKAQVLIREDRAPIALAA